MNPYYDEIVVGSSLRALLFAASRSIPVFFTEPEKPFKFDLLPPSVDLSSWGLHNEPQLWETPEGEVVTGQSKIALWEHLIFVLGIRGLVPFSDLCSSLRLDDNTLTGYTEYAKLRSVDFGVCYYFDEHATYNLLPCENTKKSYIVYDRIAFSRGGKHHLDLIRNDEPFCKEIWFYLTPRIDGKVPVKDACAVSILTEEQVDDFDFSETIARLTTLQKMKDLGLRGPKNGWQADGSRKYRSFKTETIDRKKFLLSSPVWLETDSIKVPQVTEKELLLKLPEVAKAQKRILKPLWQNI